MLEHALKYASLGIRVFPLKPRDKVPHGKLVPKGVKQATIDPKVITDWWTRVPDANIGIALGKESGVVALDLDTNHGANELDLERFNVTPTAKTANGYHLYFKWRHDLRNGIAIPGTDAEGAGYLRCDGYYVVAPPSIHPSGWQYAWLENEFLGPLNFVNMELAQFPEALVPAGKARSATAATGDAQRVLESGQGIAKSYGPNERHAHFVGTATAIRKKGGDFDKIVSELHKENVRRCYPPKTSEEKVEDEIAKVAAWAVANVTPISVAPSNPVHKLHTDNKHTAQSPKPQEETDDAKPKEEKSLANQNEEVWVKALGHVGTEYYYTSSSNRQIVSISRSSHGEFALLDLAPYSYWENSYCGPKGGVHWKIAASDLMEAARHEGIFNHRKMRGNGAWLDDTRLIFHLGDRLLTNGQEVTIGNFPSAYIYRLGPSYDSVSVDALTTTDANSFYELLSRLSWTQKHSALLLLGGMSVMRLCGALPWRPMLWLTGPAGSGKSTILDKIVKHVAGEHALYLLGNTTESGIRQAIGCDSRPVLYDEAETNGKRSASRMQGILELARQASSDSEGRIYKGTVDGKGHNFKVNCMFLLSSIRVNLTEEADRSRFTVLEVRRGSDVEGWKRLARDIEKLVTPSFGDAMFARMLALWPVLMANISMFATEVSVESNQRMGQQLGTLLAAAFTFLYGREATMQEARAQVVELGLQSETHERHEAVSDEVECLERLVTATIPFEDAKGMRRTEAIGYLIREASLGNGVARSALVLHGISCDESLLCIASKHSGLDKIYENTKWGDLYANSLARLPGALKSARAYFAGRRLRAVSLPYSSVFEKWTKDA